MLFRSNLIDSEIAHLPLNRTKNFFVYKIMLITLSILLLFIVVNLTITVFLRYQNGNDGWLEYYRRNG